MQTSSLILTFAIGPLGFVACGRETPPPSAPAEASSGDLRETPPTRPSEEAPAHEVSGAGATAPDGASEPQSSDGPSVESGRLAYVRCEEPRKVACTREYRPVCADYDTGVRCITTPCPSSEKKEFSNGCTACADPKVSGYFPARCAELSGSGDSAKAP